jgi:hypothetical protein
VRVAFRRALGVKAGHDFEFLYDGEAYIVGDALIEHGNRYDAWNQIDYDALRRVRSFQSRRQEVPFAPPAGSEMVTSVGRAQKRGCKQLIMPPLGGMIKIVAGMRLSAHLNPQSAGPALAEGLEGFRRLRIVLAEQALRAHHRQEHKVEHRGEIVGLSCDAFGQFFSVAADCAVHQGFVEFGAEGMGSVDGQNDPAELVIDDVKWPKLVVVEPYDVT